MEHSPSEQHAQPPASPFPSPPLTTADLPGAVGNVVALPGSSSLMTSRPMASNLGLKFERSLTMTINGRQRECDELHQQLLARPAGEFTVEELAFLLIGIGQYSKDEHTLQRLQAIESSIRGRAGIKPPRKSNG